MSTPKVAVVIPAHNAEKFIAKTLTSVCQQSFRAIEIIVVDDASTDNTVEVVKTMMAEDNRITLKQHAKNQGVAAARNLGTETASAQYVAFVDADDIWLPDKLALQVAFMDKHQAKLGYGSYELVDQSGAKIGQRMISEATLSHKQMLHGNRIGLLTSIVDREVALAHPFPKIRSEDYACWLSILRDGYTAYRCTDKIVARYRKHMASTSANKIQAARWTWQIYRQVEKMNIFQAGYSFCAYAFMALTDRR